MAEEDEELMPRPTWAASLLMVLVRLYQRTLGHLIGGSCRFHPSCSNYALQALQIHGQRQHLHRPQSFELGARLTRECESGNRNAGGAGMIQFQKVVSG